MLYVYMRHKHYDWLGLDTKIGMASSKTGLCLVLLAVRCSAVGGMLLAQRCSAIPVLASAVTNCIMGAVGKLTSLISLTLGFWRGVCGNRGACSEGNRTLI